MVWSCEKGNGGRNVEISGRKVSVGEKESSKTKENQGEINENDDDEVSFDVA